MKILHDLQEKTSINDLTTVTELIQEKLEISTHVNKVTLVKILQDLQVINSYIHENIAQHASYNSYILENVAISTHKNSYICENIALSYK